VSVADAELTILSTEMLEEIWRKAEGLLRSSDSMVNAPGFDGIYAQHMSNANTGNSLFGDFAKTRKMCM
jgi:hypothetical protein